MRKEMAVVVKAKSFHCRDVAMLSSRQIAEMEVTKGNADQRSNESTSGNQCWCGCGVQGGKPLNELK